MRRLQDLTAFKTGHPEIDGDHAKLAELIDAIHAEDGKETCRQLLASFIEAAKQHFTREEQILLDMGFPGLKRHCLYHDALLEQAVEVKRHCDEMSEPQHLQNCFEEMAHFFIDDVIRGDMEFVSFMQERGISPAPTGNRS